MLLFSDPHCLEYGRPGHPERPQRISETRNHLEKAFPAWRWEVPQLASRDEILRVHSPAHLERFSKQQNFDADTGWFPGILDHASRAAGSCRGDAGSAAGERAFSLLRPPGHHASAEQAMGFCYLNSVVITAQAALAEGAKRVAIWDFDAHHGNGTEALVAGDDRLVFASVHQLPGWPGTGARSQGNIRNYPIPPASDPAWHREVLQKSLDELLAAKPDLLLVSAGFDAYFDDPITDMTLRKEDFEQIGRWLHPISLPVACVLEGGYSTELPELIAGFLDHWENG